MSSPKHVFRLFLALAFLSTTVLLLGSTPPRAKARTATSHPPDHTAHDMSDEEMQAIVDAWFAAHPKVGTSAEGTPAVTFRAFSNRFDADGDVNGTPIDTVVIGVGEIVQWQRLIGVHTVTNGLDSSEPGNGTLFDVPLDSTAPVFQHLYETPGEFPFYCRVHEGLQMVGRVVVVGPVPTERASWGELKARSR